MADETKLVTLTRLKDFKTKVDEVISTGDNTLRAELLTQIGKITTSVLPDYDNWINLSTLEEDQQWTAPCDGWLHLDTKQEGSSEDSEPYLSGRIISPAGNSMRFETIGYRKNGQFFFIPMRKGDIFTIGSITDNLYSKTIEFFPLVEQTSEI